MLRVFLINLEITEKYHGASLRLITIALVSAFLYITANWSGDPERTRGLSIRQRLFSHAQLASVAYTWSASFLLALLAWYELRPVSVADAWMAAGLILFEVGLTRNKLSLRLQGYAAFAASFLRIFFVNLNAAGNPGEISPRVYTVVPLALAFFYAYWRLHEAGDVLNKSEQKFHVADLCCWLGTVTFAMLMRFEIEADWVATAWAALTLALLTIAWRSERRVFLYQALLVAVGVLFRAVMHNLYERSYFPSSGWESRWITAGSAIALLLCALPFAFQLRKKNEPSDETGLVRLLQSAVRRPEQIFFFIAVGLLTASTRRRNASWHGHAFVGSGGRRRFHPGPVARRAQLPSYWAGPAAAVRRKDLARRCLGTRSARSLSDFHRARSGPAAGVVLVYAKSGDVAAILMKRWILLAGILLLAIASVVVSERRKVDVPPSPAALLYLVADTEQELTRMPVSFTRMSDEEEIRIGDGLAKYYASGEEREAVPENTIIEHYLRRVGDQVARNAHRRLPYKFHYLPDSYLINAFALPGGHVFVGGGLLALMDSEDELAAVLGHEIEHIDHYDCAERVQREQALRKIPLGVLIEIPIEVFEAGYSKDQELQADRDGTRLAVAAGYSANGAVRMFEIFARLYEEYATQGEDSAGRTVASCGANAGRIFPFASVAVGAHCADPASDRQ